MLFSKKFELARDAKLSARLKGECVEYVMNALSEDFQQSCEREGFTELIDEKDTEQVQGGGIQFAPEFIQRLDNFILFGKIRTGQRVLGMIRSKARLSRQEKKILEEWESQAFASAFEILETAENYLVLSDTVAEVDYTVYHNRGPDQGFLKLAPQLKPKYFLYANIVPVNGRWFFSGAQTPLPPDMEETIFREFVAKRPPEDMYRNNPEKLKKAFALQKEHYDFFIKYFGADEIIVTDGEIRKMEQRYYDAWATEQGQEPSFLVPELPGAFRHAETVGIVMDEQEGWHYLIDYGKFKQIFTEPNKKPEDWQELVLGYLKDETVPAFLFERMKRRYFENYQQIMEEVLQSQQIRLSPIADFELIMDIFKPVWKQVYPSLHPINQRFEKYYYQNKGAELSPNITKIGRNAPCPCGSGKKYKRCHGA